MKIVFTLTILVALFAQLAFATASSSFQSDAEKLIRVALEAIDRKSVV